jgi:hypothetical protein
MSARRRQTVRKIRWNYAFDSGRDSPGRVYSSSHRRDIGPRDTRLNPDRLIIRGIRVKLGIGQREHKNKLNEIKKKGKSLVEELAFGSGSP